MLLILPGVFATYKRLVRALICKGIEFPNIIIIGETKISIIFNTPEAPVGLQYFDAYGCVCVVAPAHDAEPDLDVRDEHIFWLFPN